MKKKTEEVTFEDTDDLPVSPVVKIKPHRATRKGGLSWDELERLSNQRLWKPILGLNPVDDDFYPPAGDDPIRDRYTG